MIGAKLIEKGQAARIALWRLVGLFFSQSARKQNQMRDKKKVRTKLKELADFLTSPGTILTIGLIFFLFLLGLRLLTEAEKIIKPTEQPKQQRDAQDADDSAVNGRCLHKSAIKCGRYADAYSGNDANHGVAADKQREPSIAMNLDLVFVCHLPANVSSQTRRGAAPSLSVMLWIGSLGANQTARCPRTPEQSRRSSHERCSE